MSEIVSLLNSAGAAFVAFAGRMLVQSSLLIVVLVVLDLVLRKKVKAVIRYWIWLLVLAKLLLPPSLSSPTGLAYWVGDKLPSLPRQAEVADSPGQDSGWASAHADDFDLRQREPHGLKPILREPRASDVGSFAARAEPAENSYLQTSPVVAESVPPIAWQGALLLAWLVVVLVMVVLLIQRALFVRSLVAQSEIAPEALIELLNGCRRRMAITHDVELRLSSLSMSPSVCGLWRPTILVPRSMLTQLDSTQLKSVLLHELAHVKRGDLWVNLVQALLQIAYFYHPLLWPANLMIRRVREQAVDETVLAAMGDEAEEYPKTLLSVSKLAFGRPALSLRLLGVVESKKALTARIKLIVSRPFPRSAKLGFAGLILILVTAAVLLPMARAQPQDKKTTEPAATTQAADVAQVTVTADSNSLNASPGAESLGVVRTIEGIVTDPLGRPRGNVYIGPSGTSLWKGVRSDVQGRFVLKDVQSGQVTWGAWSQPMDAMALFTIPPGRIDKPIQVKLVYREAHVEGRVVGPSGEGLAGRKMEYVVKTSDGATHVLRGWGETDKFGNYEDGLIPCGAGLTVQVRLADASEADGKYITEPLALSDGQIFVAMPRLVIGDGQPAETDDGKLLFAGRVVDEHREAICGATVRLLFDMPGWMSTWVRATLTDRDGRWQMRVPKEYSNLSIGLDHPDYIGHHFDQSSEKPSKQELLDGTYLRAMKSGVRIGGVVKSEQGKPVENALITAGRFYSWSPYGEVDEDSTTARTLADGSFSIGGLPEQQLDMTVSATGYAPRIVPVEIKKDMPAIAVTLLPGRTYTGRVVDVNDRPVEGVRITIDGWRVGKRELHLTQIKTTDAQGDFRMEDLPTEGTIECDFGKRDSGLMGFSKEMPADLSQTDKVVMYKVPVFTGKVIDAGTQKPVTKFTLVNGTRGASWGDRPFWSDHYKGQIDANDGTFTYRWSGFGVTHPFTGDALLKIEAKGYLSEMAPPLKLGQECRPFVIRLTQAEPRTGVVLTAGDEPAAGAEVGWVGPDEKAFLTDGRFDTRQLVYQAEQIVKTGEDGKFELDRTRDEGLIVVVHPDGYAIVKSTEFTNSSKVTLSPWARIEGTITSASRNGEQLVVAVEQAMSSEQERNEPVQWMFEQASISGNRFAIDHIPAVPLYVGAVVRWELADPVYLEPEPGRTYSVEIGAKGRSATGRIVHPSPGPKMEMSDPRRLHAVAYRIDPEPPVPAEIRKMTRASFQWLWRDADNAYERSQTFQKRFVPEITDSGEFTFAALAPGEYELVANYHVPLGENVSCGRGVLESVAISRFTVPDDKGTTAVRVPDVLLARLTYPKVGEPAPLFESKTFSGDTIKLADLRGKVVLLDFWATWCKPCVAQLPQVQQLHETFGADGRFAMIGMSLDWDIEKAKKFLAQRQLKWPQVSLGNMDTSTVVKQYGVGSIPTMILIDPDGKIIAMSAAIEQIKEQIRSALAAR
jgi:beta-lactamase regulating signal transducer with metallopeptidase domain/peroxiredoxin